VADHGFSVNDDVLAWLAAQPMGGVGVVVTEVIRASNMDGSELDRVVTAIKTKR